MRCDVAVADRWTNPHQIELNQPFFLQKSLSDRCAAPYGSETCLGIFGQRQPKPNRFAMHSVMFMGFCI